MRWPLVYRPTSARGSADRRGEPTLAAAPESVELSSNRPLSLDRNATPFAFLWPVVPNCAVRAASVVPEGHVIQGPSESDLVINLLSMLEQHREYSVAFTFVQTHDLGCEGPVNEQRLPTRPGMCPDNWVDCFWAVDVLVIATPVPVAAFIYML